MEVAHLVAEHPREPVSNRQVPNYMVTNPNTKWTKAVLSLLGVISRVKVGPPLRKKGPVRVLRPLREGSNKWKLKKEVKKHS